MTSLKKQLAELQGRMEGKLCTDESCIVNKEIFQGKDIQEYNETSCKNGTLRERPDKKWEPDPETRD